jgi:RimJ/RimL family protein N-acetyltransferase
VCLSYKINLLAANSIPSHTMTDYNFHIDTPRLTLSHFIPVLDSHCDFLVALRTQPSSLLASSGIAVGIKTREHARTQLESESDRINPQTGYGRYLISLKQPVEDADKQPFSELVQKYTKIGDVTMKTRQYVDMPALPDLGFGLLDEYVGKGYATEAASALLRYFEQVKGEKEFLGLCHPDNEPSIKMMRRLGFREDGTRGVLGLTPDGSVVYPLCWSRGVEGKLPGVMQVADA